MNNDKERRWAVYNAHGKLQQYDLKDILECQWVALNDDIEDPTYIEYSPDLWAYYAEEKELVDADGTGLYASFHEEVERIWVDLADVEGDEVPRKVYDAAMKTED